MDGFSTAKEATVNDRADMYRTWEHTFHHNLRLNPHEDGTKLLLTSSPLSSAASHLRLMEKVFEHFGFSALSIQNTACLSLYAQGMMTGLVLDSGDSVTSATPVIDGFCLRHCAKSTKVAGNHITRLLLQLLQQRGHKLSGDMDHGMMQRLKEQSCFVALDYGTESLIASETAHLLQTYTLPDGGTLKVARERFMAPEALFQPAMCGAEGNGISDMLFQCIQECAIDERLSLYRNIVLSGGNTMLDGLSARLEKDIRNLYLTHILKGHAENVSALRLRVRATPKRRDLAFTGAAILADLMRDSTDGFWVTHGEWLEDPHRALQRVTGQTPLLQQSKK